MSSRFRRQLAVLTIASFAMQTAAAQSYPSKPVRLLSTQQAGQGGDPVARLIANRLSEALGQPFVIESQSGAGGSIATEAVVRAAPDGYTLLFASASSTIAVLFLFKNLRYDPVKGLTPITAVGEVLTTMIASPSLNANSIGDLVALARRNPGKLSYGSVGLGSTYHFLGETFKVETGTDILHVPYKGMGPMVNDLMAGRIDVSFLGMNQALPLHRQGKLRILAAIHKERYARAPEIPTLRESVPSFEKPTSFFGFFGPAGLSRPIVDRLNTEMVKALDAPDVRSSMEELTISIIGNTPEEFAALIKRGIEISGTAAKAAGLKPE
jgi:tripartite-type tricarboxylate transporter receptor subunit TctC